MDPMRQRGRFGDPIEAVPGTYGWGHMDVVASGEHGDSWIGDNERRTMSTLGVRARRCASAVVRAEWECRRCRAEKHESGEGWRRARGGGPRSGERRDTR